MSQSQQNISSKIFSMVRAQCVIGDNHAFWLVHQGKKHLSPVAQWDELLSPCCPGTWKMSHPWTFRNPSSEAWKNSGLLGPFQQTGNGVWLVPRCEKLKSDNEWIHDYCWILFNGDLSKMLSLFTFQRSLSCFASSATSGPNHICWKTAAKHSNLHKRILTAWRKPDTVGILQHLSAPVQKVQANSENILYYLFQYMTESSSTFKIIATESSKTLAWLRAQEPASKHDSGPQHPSVLDMEQRYFQGTSCGTCSLHLGLRLANLPYQSCSQHSTLGWPNGQERAHPARKAQWDGRRETVFLSFQSQLLCSQKKQ